VKFLLSLLLLVVILDLYSSQNPKRDLKIDFQTTDGRERIDKRTESDLKLMNETEKQSVTGCSRNCSIIPQQRQIQTIIALKSDRRQTNRVMAKELSELSH